VAHGHTRVELWTGAAGERQIAKRHCLPDKANIARMVLPEAPPVTITCRPRRLG
jgi:hypothetical protein